MGWLWLLLFASATMAALVVMRVPRLLWSFVGAALMLGAAGYAWQGRPGLSGRSAVPARTAAADDEGLIDLREQMWGRFTRDGAYMIAAEAMSRAGERRAAVQAVLIGIHHTPDSGQLWTGLGTTLAAHDGVLSPPARFAFAQAVRLAPRHPAPPFFMGLAAVRASDFAAARPLWARALALTPRGAPYRDAIADRLALLDRFLAMDTGATQ